MAAYVIIDVEVTDETLYAEYRQQVAPLVASHGGRHLANASESEVVGGDWTPHRLLLLEFPDAEQASEYASSLEAPELQEMRARCVGGRNIVVVPGL